MSNRTKKQLCLWIPPPLDESLRELANRSGRAITDLATEALEDVLKKYGGRR